MFALLILSMAADAAPAVAVAPADQTVRCIREEVTGSLSTTRRVCHTVGEWRRIRSDSNDELRRFNRSGTLNALNADPDPNARQFTPGRLGD